ncbi:MAG TPA: PAS domain-containing sensor histidine kinase, partial [Chitinophagaceae bacterium]|nr:PAS domain-containing sensor histidine kinase [Chitinophagaceae bacterium]
GSSSDKLNDALRLHIHPEELYEYFSLWEKSIADNTRFELVHRLKKNNEDEYAWHYTQALPFKDYNNDTVAWFGISTDIDEQKRALDKKDEFISIASHELKTPVTSIKGYVQLLRFNFQQEGNAEAASLLTKADIQINKLTSLITDLLDVRKIENGQLRYHEDTFEFNSLVREIIEETERVTRHPIEYAAGPDCTVRGDRNKIGQVITNFIDNAAKYSPAHAVIKVATDVQDARVKLSVQDFGLGIPKDQQGKIFERFFRVSGEKENTYAGLGLGLYISAEIIKRHKGSIGVESEHGKGSTFYFELPTFKKPE